MSMISPLTKSEAMKIKECPECKSENISIAVYPDGKRFLECEGCYSVIADIKQ